jgi:translocation and assembly module TamB
MRLLGRIAAVFGTILLVVIGLVGGGIGAANTDVGRRFLERQVFSLSGGGVRLTGLAGAFPTAPRIGEIDVADADGVWLRMENIVLDWRPARLLSGELSIAGLRATRLAVLRLPVAAGGKSSGGGFALPLTLRLDALEVRQLKVAKPVAGVAAVFSLTGSADVPRLDRAVGQMTLRRLDGDGVYRLEAHQDAAGMHAVLEVDEPAGGLIAGLSGVAGPIKADAAVDGPADALATRLTAAAGALRLAGEGRVDLSHSRADLQVSAPELGPFAALAGLDLAGKTTLRLRPDWSGKAFQIAADGRIGVSRGPQKLAELVGGDATIGLSATIGGDDYRVSRFDLAGKAVTVSASGAVTGKQVAANWTFSLPDLAVLRPSVVGALRVAGRVAGPLDNLAGAADATGQIAAPEIPGDSRSLGDFSAHVEATGLPALPAAKVTAAGVLAGAPIQLEVAGAKQADGAYRVTIGRAEWRSVHGQGDLTLPAGAVFPFGRLDVRVGQLADLRVFTGIDLAGALSAVLDSRATGATLMLDARDAGMVGGVRVGTAKIDAKIPDPAHPVADLVIAAQNIRVPGMVEAIGLDATARLDVAGRQLDLRTLQARRQADIVRLLAPARIGFGDAVRMDRLLLGWRDAVLELAGQVEPALDLKATLRGVTPDLAAPGLAMDGRLQGDARLTGTIARPSGTVHLEATGLRARTGPGRALPMARITADARLDGRTARIDAHATAGAARLAVTGTAPLDPAGMLDLQAAGAASLTMLDPLLAPAGRRARGELAVDATLRGTVAKPQIGGVARLAGGSFRDYVTGLTLSEVAATLRAAGDSVRIETLTARAGPGRIDVTGSVGVFAPGLPVDLSLMARDARPVASDRLSATLDADVRLRGLAESRLDLAGRIGLKTAEIRIPERLPASIPVLNIRNAPNPGVTPKRTALAPVAAPEVFAPANIHLDLTLDAPGRIYLRGRGIDAELGGRVHIAGTAADPVPEGKFTIRRGQFSLAGQTLEFTRGAIGFGGGAATDPSLDFLISRTSGGVTANLAIVGFASDPKIVLSSVPDQPQDEVLSHLLLGRSAAALGPLELAQIAAALASLTGVAPGIGDPLNDVRTRLGLDRLSIGNSAGNSTLEAGRYLAPGVYVGARKSLSSDGAQSVVQIDIGRGVKLEGTVGTGTASATGSDASQGTGVSVIYEKDY